MPDCHQRSNHVAKKFLAFLFTFGLIFGPIGAASAASYYFYLTTTGGTCPAGTQECTLALCGQWGVYDDCPHGTVETATGGSAAGSPAGGVNNLGAYIYKCVGGSPCGGVCDSGGGGKLCFSGTPPIYATSVSLNKTSTIINVNGTETLAATVMPINASDKTVSWSSSNTAAATVSSGGEITAKAGGIAVITVTTGDGTNKTASCLVTSKVPVTGVSVGNCPSTSLNKGSGHNLTTTISPSNATIKDVSWSSSNAGVAEVDNNGAVTANGAGTATITVRTSDENKTATCGITVYASVTGVSLSPSSFTLSTVGDTKTLTATFSPPDASNKGISWSTSNSTVATVNSSGVVTAKATGTATITATSSENSAHKASSNVTVPTQEVYASSLRLSPCPMTIAKGSSKTLSYSFNNAPTQKSVSLSSSDTGIANHTLTETGTQQFTIYGNSPGTATITAKEAYSNKSAICSVTVPYLIHTHLTSVCGDNYINSGCSGYSSSGKSQNGTFTLTGCPSPSSGTIYGNSRCSSTSPAQHVGQGIPSNNSGKYCWCQLKQSQNSTNTGAWTHGVLDPSSTNSICETYCAGACANWAGNVPNYGSAGVPVRAAMCAPSNAAYPIHNNLKNTVCGTKNPGYIEGTYTASAPYRDAYRGVDSGWCILWGCDYYAMCRMCSTNTTGGDGTSNNSTCGEWHNLGVIGNEGSVIAWTLSFGTIALYDHYKNMNTFERARALCRDTIESCGTSPDCSAVRARLCGP